MNRRRFLSLLGQAATGAAVVYSFPSIIVPKNIQPVVLGYGIAPHGLAWLINDSSRILQGLSDVVFPDLNSPSIDLRGATLNPALLNLVRSRLNSMAYQTM